MEPRQLGSDAAIAERLVEEAPDALLALSLGGRVLSWNRGAASIFGYSPDEAQGRLLEELIVPPEERESAREQLAIVVRVGTTLFEAPRRRRDGTLLNVDVTMRRVDTAGAEPFIAVSKKDVTERKRLEERLREGSRLKNEFLANMSHELRTPLNAIIGFAELMHNGKVGPVSSDHQEYLGDILTSSKHLLQLINDVLDLAKVEAGKIEFRPELIDVGKIVSEVRDILRGLAASRRLRVDLQIATDVSLVTVDPARLKQVLYNYLSNAIKFTPEGGVVTARVSAAGPDLFRIDVDDTGIGVAPEDIGKLFVEFQQLDAGDAKRYQGTGLGLALTKRIIEAQGGWVEVQSVLGQGSTFSAILPRCLDANPNLEPLRVPPPLAEGMSQ